MLENEPVAVLDQEQPGPEIDGVSKPTKPGGYADSSATSGESTA